MEEVNMSDERLISIAYSTGPAISFLLFTEERFYELLKRLAILLPEPPKLPQDKPFLDSGKYGLDHGGLKEASFFP